MVALRLIHKIKENYSLTRKEAYRKLQINLP